MFSKEARCRWKTNLRPNKGNLLQINSDEPHVQQALDFGIDFEFHSSEWIKRTLSHRDHHMSILVTPYLPTANSSAMPVGEFS